MGLKAGGRYPWFETTARPPGLQSIQDGWAVETIGVPMVQQVYGIWQYLEDASREENLHRRNKWM